MSISASISAASRQARVAIIGAGPSGLAMASELLHLAPGLTPVLFERRPKVGGVWTYDPSPGTCDFRFDRRGRAHPVWAGRGKDGDADGTFCPPGPMYDGLRTNLPCDLMAYRDAPFDPSTPLFPQRREVEEYIDRFAEAKRLLPLIRFETAVTSVQRVKHQAGQPWGRGSVWRVRSRPIHGGDLVTEEFDYIVSASGRCNMPSVPYIDGLWHFRGQLLHSAWYRQPHAFRGKKVLVIGNSSSGSDIARELVGHVVRSFDGSQQWIEQANAQPPQTGVTVLQSYEDVQKPPPLDFDPRDQDSPAWAKRIRVVPKIQRVEPAEDGKDNGRIVLEDGQVLDDVDAIVFGTGYAYDLPYLSQEQEPFASAPLIPPPPPASTPAPASLQTYLSEHQSGKAYDPPFRTAPFLTNLDDWSLFYQADPSFALLGAPIRIVPLPFTNAQSRIVAAFWAGLLAHRFQYGLPRLNPDIPTTEPDHWRRWLDDTVPPYTEQKEECGGRKNKTSDLGYPGDTAYQDGLSDLLPAELRTRGQDEDRAVEAFSGVDGPVEAARAEDEMVPTQATDEGWRKVATFRNQRRQTTKRLRRQLLGY
ncbi:uncharacterized protein PFL1_00459 [Pseudozyma flocculosa PF-1]|uniref:Related to FMO1 - flavin-containing monooxygenase n=1 Tax=Pseudozyma flocculosa TaxID=84751 RepID=A0A5C3ETC9_9BASI|nr:uncharacterized protein PFL1_00459 [Pseudozyma flocculosa PF-1]EPQ32262.1 hypothetical protein PFL1_00459 [Pseudozyma flocculosa PF-1]SPO34786.1 related to FMO1 - flavin-containing monooxygenase [Pseudozyma flocculosa]